jgi:hypothetical protein
MAYEEDVKVNAHSTRAIGPSWAIFKGASVVSILKAADWSRDSTFTIIFFLRTGSAKVLSKLYIRCVADSQIFIVLCGTFENHYMCTNYIPPVHRDLSMEISNRVYMIECQARCM